MASARHSDSEGAAAWIAVGVLIAGALVVAGGIVAANLPLSLVGAAVIVVCLIVTAIMARLGKAPVSFSEEFPAATSGPRATSNGDSSPPIDTEPSPAHTGAERRSS